MKVVSDSTPLIGLALIQHFDFLRRIFGEIWIARAVYNEVVTEGKWIEGAKHQVLEAEWIKMIDVTDQLAVDVLLDELDAGEAETIVLARELQADWVLMDERKGRRKLTQLGINKIGTVGILLKAKQLGLVSQVEPELQKLCQKGFSISQTVIDAVLLQAGENK